MKDDKARVFINIGAIDANELNYIDIDHVCGWTIDQEGVFHVTLSHDVSQVVDHYRIYALMRALRQPQKVTDVIAQKLHDIHFMDDEIKKCGHLLDVFPEAFPEAFTGPGEEPVPWVEYAPDAPEVKFIHLDRSTQVSAAVVNGWGIDSAGTFTAYLKGDSGFPRSGMTVGYTYIHSFMRYMGEEEGDINAALQLVYNRCYDNGEYNRCVTLKTEYPEVLTNCRELPERS